MSNAAYHGGNADVLYSKDDHKRISSIFHVQVAFMTGMAQIPFKLERRFPKSLAWLGWLLARIYCAFWILLAAQMAFCFVITTYDKFFNGQLEEVTDSLTMFVIYSFTLFGACYWLYRSTQLENFLQHIDREHRHHSLAGLTFVSSHRAYASARKLTNIWLFACNVSVTLWALAPIILWIRILPLKCWYPFDVMQPIVFEFTYLLQVLAQIMVGTIFANGSALYVSLLIVMLGQFDVLFCSLKNFYFHAKLMSGEDLSELRKIQKELPMESDDELSQYLYATEYKTNLAVYRQLPKVHVSARNAIFEKELHTALVECIKHHRFILDTCAEMEEMFNPYCLVKSLQITFQLCLLVFVGVAGERSLMRVINMAQYVCFTITELLIFTDFGELMRNHSVRGGDALWRASWWRNATCIRKDILIFLINSKRGVKVTAGKFYTMDVEHLRSVIAQAFSFLTLLQKLNEKKEINEIAVIDDK